MNTVAETLFRAVAGDAGWGGLRETVKEELTGNSPAILADERNGYLDVSAEQLGTIAQPALLVGAKDSPPEFAEVTNLMAKAMPSARVEWVEGGHLINPAHPPSLASWMSCSPAGRSGSTKRGPRSGSSVVAHALRRKQARVRPRRGRLRLVLSGSRAVADVCSRNHAKAAVTTCRATGRREHERPGRRGARCSAQPHASGNAGLGRGRKEAGRRPEEVEGAEREGLGDVEATGDEVTVDVGL
jgi:hypothetical protein